MDNKFESAMRRVISKAEESLNSGSLPLAAALVDRKNGEIAYIVSKHEVDQSDPTAHPERIVLAMAGEINLGKYALLSNVPPCHGCISFAVSFANIGQIIYAAKMDDIEGNDYGIENYSPEDFVKNLKTWNGSKPEIIGGVLRDECRVLVQKMVNWQVVK